VGFDHYGSLCCGAVHYSLVPACNLFFLQLLFNRLAILCSSNLREYSVPADWTLHDDFRSKEDRVFHNTKHRIS